MNIGLIVPGFSADDRDWCIPALLNHARALAAGNSVRVWALRYPHRRDRYQLGRVVVQSLDGRTRRGAASAGLWTAALRSIAEEHRRAPFDVLHAIYGGEAGLVTVLAGKLLRVPTVVSLVGGELVGLQDIGYGGNLSNRQRLMNKLALQFADRVLAASEAVAALARACVSPSRASRVVTLPLGVDTELFSPAFNGADPAPAGARAPVHLLNVGSLIPVKGQTLLLEAFSQLCQELPTARMSLVGSGELASELQLLARNLGLGERVQFAGAVRHEFLPALYRSADLVVQASYHEGEGMAVLEAAACGTAIAGTEVGVLADLARRGGAVAAPVGEPQALAQAIRRALVARPHLASRARELVEQEYSLERTTQRSLELYRSLALRNGRESESPVAPRPA